MITIIDSDQHSSNQVIEKRIYVTEDKMSERDNIGEHALVRNAAGALVDLTTMVPSKGVNASNISSNGSTGSPLLSEQPYEITQELWLRGILIFLYTVIFILGVSGNLLVVFVVVRNKSMQTITNIFITNLAVSDIMMCLLAVPFTPLSAFLKSWVFGDALCHILPMTLGVSVYVSTLTSTAIAIDR